MKHNKGRYYLGRVVKAGQLDQARLMDALIEASSLTIGKFNWTITDVVDSRRDQPAFVFGRLAKFLAEGHITVVDTRTKAQAEAAVPHLLVASAPFVYLPEFSGIAYLHVWNEIQEDLFARRFKSIIEATYDNFFVDCSIEPIADYRAFSAKLKELDLITEIVAKVHPPNPLFGKIWKPLRDYLAARNATEVSIRENQEMGGGLNTRVTAHLDAILQNPEYEPAEEPAIGDSALLMAADGYGMGKVTGTHENQEITIRTSDTQKSFVHRKEPTPSDLAVEAHKRFTRVSQERRLEH